MTYEQTAREIASGQRAIMEQYFKTSFVGSGTTEASFDIPFMPDVLFIAGFSANQESVENLYVNISLDLKSDGYWGAAVVFTNGNRGVTANGVKRTSLVGNYFYEGGIFTWNFSEPEQKPWIFSPDFTYYVTAAKFPD